MNLSPTIEQRMIQSTARQFAQDKLHPVAAELDKGLGRDTFLTHLKQLAELGFMGLNINSQYGGTEAGVVAFSLAITEIARACASTAVTVSVTNMVAEVIQAIASPQQCAEHLPKLCSGEYPAGSFCLSETTAGSDPSSMTTRAIQEGQDWVLNGSKMWITSAEYAGIFVVWAVTDPDAPPGKGISCFLIERQTAGLIIEKAEAKMGQHGSATNAIRFVNCRIPAAALIGERNDGYRIAVKELAGGRIGIGSLALGVAMAAMDYATDYIQQRQQFGQAISDFQGIQWMLADTYTELEAARLLLLSAACQRESDQPFAKQASMAKLYSSEAANRACYNALQLMGGVGYSREYPLERYARDVRITTIYEGSSEIQRIIIARDILKNHHKHYHQDPT